MSISSIDAGRVICKLSGWKASNLRIQKILYIAYMHYLGKHDKHLIREDFEAWQYGPVEPKLYNFCKDFRKDPVTDVFPYENIKETNKKEFAMLDNTVNWARDKTEGYLIKYTHSKSKGAWHRTFYGLKQKKIPYSLIKEEYNNRKEEHESKG